MLGFHFLRKLRLRWTVHVFGRRLKQKLKGHQAGGVFSLVFPLCSPLWHHRGLTGKMCVLAHVLQRAEQANGVRMNNFHSWRVSSPAGQRRWGKSFFIREFFQNFKMSTDLNWTFSLFYNCLTFVHFQLQCAFFHTTKFVVLFKLPLLRVLALARQQLNRECFNIAYGQLECTNWNENFLLCDSGTTCVSSGDNRASDLSVCYEVLLE